MITPSLSKGHGQPRDTPAQRAVEDETRARTDAGEQVDDVVGVLRDAFPAFCHGGELAVVLDLDGAAEAARADRSRSW